MARNRWKKAPFPSREDVLAFLRDNPGEGNKRQIARAFRLAPEQHNDLKKMLRALHRDGLIHRGRASHFAGADALPRVCVLEITGTDQDGEPVAKPVSWDSDSPPPLIHMAPEKRGRTALGPGDRVLARMEHTGTDAYLGRTIRRITAAPVRVLGVYDISEGRGRLRPTDKRNKRELVVETADSMGAQPGDLVRAEVLPGRRVGLRQAKIVERLGGAGGAKSISLIAIHDHDIPTGFSDEARRQAEAAGPAPAENREDLRNLPPFKRIQPIMFKHLLSDRDFEHHRKFSANSN